MFPQFRNALAARMPLTRTGEAKLPIGHAIRYVRIQRGISSYRLAKKSGLRRCYVSRIERDELCVGPQNLILLARALDIEPWKLYRYAFKLLEGMAL